MHPLKQIVFRNFKRFNRFTVSCHRANVLVGPNNAGKSSILDAMRVLYGALRSVRRLTPKLIRVQNGHAWGYEVADTAIPISIKNIAHNYTDDSASIEFVHENGTKLVIEIHPTHVTRLYIKEARRTLTDGRSYFSSFPIDIVIVPTLSPFEQEEPYVTEATVERNRATRLSSRHFRNIWKRSSDEEFSQFAALVQQTWPGISILRPHLPVGSDAFMEMFYREGRIDREISWAGFGFQVWLQILTHALRGSPDSIFVLDEPDVYLHPDLQRKLVEFIESRFGQFFIATHSTEIINYCSPGDIVSINSNSKSSKRIRSDEEYNEVFAYIGSIENVELSKLSRAKRVVFFEGKDKKILNKFCDKIGISNIVNSSDTLIIGVGCFGQWRRVIEAAWTFRSVLQVEVSILSIFDSDYRDPRDIEDMKSEVTSQDVKCTVWDRKEIENYALSINSLRKTLKKKISLRGEHEIDDREADEIIDRISEPYKHDIHGQLVSNAISYERRCGSGKDNSSTTKECSVRFDKTWNSLEDRLKIIPGKQFVADLSSHMQTAYGCSVTMNNLIDDMLISDLSPSLVETLRELEAFCLA